VRRRIELPGLLLVAAVLLVSCSSASASEPLAALNIMDSAGFHSMDTTLNGANGAIDAQWLGRTRSARIAVASTSWPEELQPQAKAFVEAAGKLQAALGADDASAAAGHAKAAHETQHDLSADAYTYLAGKAGIHEAGNGGH
jgi:hypothetical protein